MEIIFSQLETKIWYRFLKVIYLTIFLLTVIGFNIWIMKEITYMKDVLLLLLINVVIIFIFFLIRGAFYYIALGKFNPNK